MQFLAKVLGPNPSGKAHFAEGITQKREEDDTTTRWIYIELRFEDSVSLIFMK